jgi:hypothetical protein
LWLVGELLGAGEHPEEGKHDSTAEKRVEMIDECFLVALRELFTVGTFLSDK